MGMTTGRGGYHRGTDKEYDIVKLPSDWHFMDGLTFPYTLNKSDGKKLTFHDYQEYHEYISQLFKP